MALDAIIFDVDGTLVDSNAQQVEGWRRALESRGYKIATDRIFTEVGKGGDTLVPDLLGKSADDKDGDALREAQPKEFEKLARAQGLRPFPHAVDLLAELGRRKIATVLATSSGKKALKVIEETSGVKWSELVDEVVNADDAERSKPHPDLVHAAAKQLSLSPAQCAMIGDTPYDATAAKHAGVVTLGVLCGGGGNTAPVLLEAGARTVYDDVAAILDQLDRALEKASPGSAHLTQAALESLMKHALAAAEEGMRAGEAPIGCVLARGDGTILASGFNELNRTQNKTAHAEMVTFARAAGAIPTDARELLLVSTLEPCVMCTGAAMEAAVDTIIYALKAPADSGTGRVKPPSSPESQMPRIVGDVLAKQSKGLFDAWLKTHRGTEQAKYVEQLLELNDHL